MAEDIFKEFTPEEIAKAYEELCDDLCNKVDPQIGTASEADVCCDDEANDIDANTDNIDRDNDELDGLAVPPDEDGEVRANSIIECMAGVESQIVSIAGSTDKIQNLIDLKYELEELYFHYLIAGQYFEGKKTFVKYMIDELAVGGVRASNAAKAFSFALSRNVPKSPDKKAKAQLKSFTCNAAFIYKSGKPRLQVKFPEGLYKDSWLPRDYRDYQNNNEIIYYHPKDRENKGDLYNTYLDAAAHLDDVFTLQERGLSMDTPDSELVGTGAEVYMDKFIGNLRQFNDFHAKFKPNFENKMVERREKLSYLAYVAGESLRLQAEHEAANKIHLSGYPAALSWADGEAAFYREKLRQLKRDLDWTIDEIKTTEAQLMINSENITNIPCLGEASPDNTGDHTIFDGDDSGKAAGLDFSNTIDFPNFTQMAYWRRFALMATLVGILPLPGPGMFRYWPIGMILPPALRIPLPIIWLPIKAIATPFGVFVFFIGLSGILPSPFLFFISPTGQKRFLISVTPTGPFGSDANNPPMKPMSMGGISIPRPIFSKPQISSKESSKNMVETYSNKVKGRISVKQADLVAYNIAEDKSVVVKDIVARSAKGLSFGWQFPSGSGKVNPKLSDAQTLKETKGGGDAKSALAGLSILGKLGKIQAPKLPFGSSQKPVKISSTVILNVVLQKLSITSDIKPETTQDLKTLITESMDSSTKDVESHFSPILSVADGFKDIAPKTIPETLKLSKISFSTDTVQSVDPELLKVAQKATAAISLIPYPAVAFLPQIFKMLHPILTNDDLPPWERLSLKNFLFVAFLDEFCKNGKMGSIMPV